MIEGPICTTSICGEDVKFKVMSPSTGKKVGKISKKRNKNFGIKFPSDLDVRMKAVLLGACMLIQFHLKYEKEVTKATTDLLEMM